MTGLEFFLPLIAGQKIKEGKDKATATEAAIDWNLFEKKEEYKQNQKEIWAQKQRKQKIEDEAVLREQMFREKLANLPKEKQAEARAKFDAQMITEGFTGLAFDRAGKLLPFETYSQRVIRERKQTEIRDKLESEERSFLQTQRLEQSNLALQTATIQAQNKARATFAEQGYGDLETEGMAFEEFAIAVKEAKEKDALAATSAEERQKVIEKYVGMGYGKFLKDDNGKDRPYEDFIKLAVDQEQKDILGRKKTEITQEKTISAEFEKEKREEVALEELKKQAFEHGININDEKYTKRGESWEDDLRLILGNKEGALTFEEKNSLTLLNEINKTNELNKIAAAIDEVKETEFTLFKDLEIDGEKITPFVMPKKIAGTAVKATDRLRKIEQWATFNFNKVAQATGGLENPDMKQFVFEFSNAYIDALNEQTNPTEKGVFKPTHLGVTFLAKHPYLGQIIKRHHQNKFNINDLLREGAILGRINPIPISDVVRMTTPNDDGSFTTISGININWRNGTLDEQKTYVVLANEVDTNRGFGGDPEAVQIAMAGLVNTKTIDGELHEDISAVQFYNELRNNEGYSMLQLRQIDPIQKTAAGNPITYNHSVTEAITRVANKHFESPGPFIRALSFSALAGGGTSANNPAEHARQQGFDLEALTKQNFDAGGLLQDVDGALRTLTEDALKDLRVNPKHAVLLQNNGVPITSDPYASSDLFGLPLNTHGTLFSTLGDQIAAVMKTAKGYAGLGDSQLATAIINQYEDTESTHLKRWTDFNAVNPDTNTKYVVEEAARRGMSVNAFITAEEKAREANKKALEDARAVLSNPDAKTDEIAAARRQFYAFTMAYKLASLLQGGTGGRTISDQDVQNMFRILSQDRLASPQKFGESMLNIKKMAKDVLEVNQMISLGLTVDEAKNTPHRPILAGAKHFRDFHAATFIPTFATIENYLRYGTPTGTGSNVSQELNTSSNQRSQLFFEEERVYPKTPPGNSEEEFRKAVDLLYQLPTPERLKEFEDTFGKAFIPENFKTKTLKEIELEKINQVTGMNL